MLNLNGRTVLLGGFHDHWSRADAQNPALLLAALNFYHYDFVCLMCGNEADAMIGRAAAAYSSRLKVYLGREDMFGWGHLVTLTPGQPPLPQDDADWTRTLGRMKGRFDLVLLAHPAHAISWDRLFRTGEVDRLIDEGLVDGVELTVGRTGRDGAKNAELIDWFRARDRAGKRTPIVGGWDVHMTVPAGPLPPVLYPPHRPPDGHYEAPCNNRTLVFAERNTLADVCAAVRAGRTLVEDMRSGELVGPAELVEFLERNGYRDAIRRLDEARDALALTAERPLVGGQTTRVSVSRGGGGTLRWPVTLEQTRDVPTRDGRPEQELDVPLLLERDESYLPVAWHDGNGTERIWAVHNRHPIEFDVIPRLDDMRPAVDFRPRTPFEGTVRLEVDGEPRSITATIGGEAVIPLDRRDLLPDAVGFRAVARSRGGVQRTVTGSLSYFPVRRFRGNWDEIPTHGVDTPRHSPDRAFGKSREWPGPDVYSAQLRFAWDDDALYFRADVVDAIHFQPYVGHFAYNGDCLQLAIDPLLRRHDTIGYHYSYNLALTAAGAELFRLHSPTGEALPTFTPPPRDESLGDRFLTISKTPRGLRYDLRLPWSQLAPAVPAPGVRLGAFYGMFNNDGQGHLDFLQWPNPLSGVWGTPNRWGVLTLME